MKAAIVAGVLVTAPPILAHHSAAAIYVMERTVTVEGIVTRFNLGNPHMRIYFTRTDQEDRATEWVAEGGSRTVLTRRGWSLDTVKPGDHVVLLGNPARDSRTFIHINQITLPDGQKLATEDIIPKATARPACDPSPGSCSETPAR